MKKILPILAIAFFSYESDAQDSLKTLKAVRVATPPKMDGLLDDEAWKNAESVSDFIQNTPVEKNPVTQRTEVRIVYDNYAIYVGAMMYDSAPDSVLKELGNRDDNGLNAEKFRFVIDPYNTRQDAYDFGVYSSGVQADYRFSDGTYNGVWQSAVKILSNGWSVEMKIPYSAIRFPKVKDQKWGLQLTRDIRRCREFDQWCLTPGGQSNPQKFWGTLIGISDIQPPVRLSLSPYLSWYYEKAPEYNADGSVSYANSFSYNAGADIKYGLDERFTLDMTLLPDFGQVQSDNKIKNLGYREVTYEDYRPFFKEGTELFNKDQLFYSRRIGRTPSGFYSVGNYLDSGETIEKNPAQAKLLNSTKISGRGNGGLGFGLLNAVTGNTYAEIHNSVYDTTRRVLTEPFTNYNAIVFDQQLKNASNIYFINTNVARNGAGYRDANVTGTGFTFQNKKNSWAVDGSANLSQIFTQNGSVTDNYNDQMGFFYFAGVRKTSGKLQYSLGHSSMNKTFDRSDMGYQSIGNYSNVNAWVGYNIYKPWKFLLRSYNNFSASYSYNYTTLLPTGTNLNLNLFGITKKNWGIWCGASMAPTSTYDYYEPRVEGRYFRSAEWYFTNAGFSTNYQKKFAIDFSFNTGNFLKGNIHDFPLEQGWGGEIKPRFRFNDKFSIQAAFNYAFDPLNPGFANFDSIGDPVFGGRELNTYVNTLTLKYIFKNDLSLSINGRHYWATGRYRFYYNLMDDGTLTPNDTYSGNNDFSYNAFNIDAVFSWQFSPGSVFSVVYKNAIEQGDQVIPTSFGHNFSNTLESPQTNSISLKVLYYLDYQQFKRKKSTAK